jgi:hypothetical protein
VCIIDTRRSHEKEWHHQYEVIAVSGKSFRMKERVAKGLGKAVAVKQ